MADIIIYTAITGDYDALRQPSLPAEGFRFICFVNKGSKKSDFEGAWQIIEIPEDCTDRTLLARKQKLNPHKVLPEDCEYSLWIDGNIIIKDDSLYRRCLELQSRNILYAGIRHPFNDCPYAEAEKCLKDRREKFSTLMRVVSFLRRDQVSEHSGMMETNLILRKHNDPAVVRFDEMWWERLRRYSNRDQLTHTSCIKDNPEIKPELLFDEGISARNHPGLEYVRHPSKPLIRLQRKFKYGIVTPARWILHLYIRITGLR